MAYFRLLSFKLIFKLIINMSRENTLDVGGPGALQSEALFTGQYWRGVIALAVPAAIIAALVGQAGISNFIDFVAEETTGAVTDGATSLIRDIASWFGGGMIGMAAAGGTAALISFLLMMRLIGRKGRTGARRAHRRIVG